MLAALKTGCFYATTGLELEELVVDGERLRLRAQGAEKIRFIGGGGKLLAEVHASTAEYAVRGDEKYVRAEVEGTSSSGLSKAWLQPIWVG